MTKPSDFIFSSDYLTIAQVNKTEPQTVFFPARQFPTESGTVKPFSVEYELYSPATPGAIDRIQMVYNGTTYCCSQFYRPPDITVTGGVPWISESWVFSVYRKDEKTLVARGDFIPPSSSGTPPTVPALTFTVSAVTFKAPNVI